MAPARTGSPETTGSDREASITTRQPTSHIGIDIYRTATILVREYGPELAPTMAAKHARKLFASGDRWGCLFWCGVVNAAQELTRTKRKLSERVN